MQLSVILTSIGLIAALMLPHSSLAKNKPATQTAGNGVFVEMSEAYKRNDRKRLTALLPQAKGHVLEPWAAYWEMSSRLDDASVQEIQDFLARYADSYQEDRLRNEWLLLLGKRREWPTFLAELPKFRMNDDPEVRCYALLADASVNDADVASQVMELWLAQREPDEGCAAAAAHLLKQEKLTATAIWQRARLGFEFDKPRIAMQAVGLINPDLVFSLNAIYQKPENYLDEKFFALRPRTKELVTLALVRLASSNFEAAATEIDKLRWRAQLTLEERSWIWGVIGKRAARSLSDKALGYYAQGQETQMHSDHLIWRARAALRAGAWEQVLTSIASLSPTLRKEPDWIYWRARALVALNQPDAPARAQALYESIASTKGFYEQLALEELGLKITVPAGPEPLSEEERDAALNHPGLKRALYAIQMGLRTDGVREWNYSTNLHQRGGMSDRELLAAAGLACEQKIWDRCISTSQRTRSLVDFEQRYPTPYLSEVNKRALKAGIDPAFVYGLIRQESRFIAEAQSNVGAAGLMQVMPATARWTARKIGMSNFRPKQITDRETNITIGTSYLKLVLDNFGGSMPLAAAAYNAGPSRSRNWRGLTGDPLLEAAIWAENVPFPETRDYIKKVLANTTNYAALLTGQPQSLKTRLGMIGPIGADKLELIEELP
jgi:soluble lytic murein transglycosylase